MSASMTVNEEVRRTSDVTKTCHRPAREPYPRLARQAASIGFDGSTWQRKAGNMLEKNGQTRAERTCKGPHSIHRSGHIPPQISMMIMTMCRVLPSPLTRRGALARVAPGAPSIICSQPPDGEVFPLALSRLELLRLPGQSRRTSAVLA